MTETVRIALALKHARGGSGREFLIGAFSYANRKPNWEILRGRNSASLSWEATLKKKPDAILGVLVRESFSYDSLPAATRVVILNAYHWDHPFHRVVSDSREAGRRSASHLLERHYRQFAFIGADWADFSSQRYDGFVERLQEAGIQGEIPSQGALAMQDHPEEFRRWLRALPQPCGILCAQDDIGIRVIK